MCRGDVEIRGGGDNAWKIEFTDNGGKFQSLANGQSITGPRPIMIAADEIHEFKANDSIETWKRAIAKMPGDALMLLGTNTPASSQIVGTEYSEFYQKVAKGKIVDDEAFAFICRVDKKDRENVFDNESCWPKALPALGTTFPEGPQMLALARFVAEERPYGPDDRMDRRQRPPARQDALLDHRGRDQGARPN